MEIHTFVKLKKIPLTEPCYRHTRLLLVTFNISTNLSSFVSTAPASTNFFAEAVPFPLEAPLIT